MWGALLLLALCASESLADECFCSGVTTQCREATTYYWATLRQAILQMGTPKLKCWTLRLQAKEGEHGFKLTDKDQEEDLEVEYQAEYERALVDVKDNLIEKEGPDLTENMKDEIRDWFGKEK